ncbi:hypothetical protein WMY93_008134 [Mugilogobius chulae]|uniref:Insulin-like domain-containing protein n=1 Tax=Mugilogobius chulae TaxID=88201 RepID=A0AAW0PLK4_9GOBI
MTPGPAVRSQTCICASPQHRPAPPTPELHHVCVLVTIGLSAGAGGGCLPRGRWLQLSAPVWDSPGGSAEHGLWGQGLLLQPQRDTHPGIVHYTERRGIVQECCENPCSLLALEKQSYRALHTEMNPFTLTDNLILSSNRSSLWLPCGSSENWWRLFSLSAKKGGELHQD